SPRTKMTAADRTMRMADTPSAILRQRMKSILLFGLKSSIEVSRRSDRQCLELGRAAEDQDDEGMGAGHRSEHRRENTDRQGDGEAANRSRAEGHQTERGDQMGDVGVENGRPGFFVTRADGSEGRQAVAQFLAYSFADEHVGVDR